MASRILRSMQLEIARRSRPVASIFLDFAPPNEPGITKMCTLTMEDIKYFSQPERWKRPFVRKSALRYTARIIRDVIDLARGTVRAPSRYWLKLPPRFFRRTLESTKQINLWPAPDTAG